MGIRQIIKGLNEVFSQDKDGKVNIALETMAGKGTEIGRSFEEIAAIYDGVTYNERLRVCFDTCHTSDAGYDVREDFASVIEQFDRIIGKDQIAVFHINDSKNPQEHIKTVMKILDLERLDMIAFGILYTIKTLKPFLKY